MICWAKTVNSVHTADEVFWLYVVSVFIHI